MGNKLFDNKEMPFDRDLSLDLYKMYLSTNREDVLEELLLQIIPLINIVCKLDIDYTVGECNLPMLKTEAIEHIFFKLREARFPVDNPRTFMNYLWVMIRNAMVQAIRDNLSSKPFQSWVYVPPTGRIEDFDDAEARLYASQLRYHMFNIFKADIRFVGNERDACIFMAECMLGFRKLDPMTARFRFRLSRPRVNFLYQYVRYLLKNAAHAVRQIDRRIAVGA